MPHLSNLEGTAMEGKLPEVRLANTPFRVVSPYRARGRSAPGHSRACQRRERRPSLPNASGRYRIGQNVHHGQNHRGRAEADAGARPQQDARGAACRRAANEFFPDNSVVYFVSYYDYYQPEAYVPASDTFIEKDASINEEVEKLRHAATSALLSRRDCIVVASVSCIYGIGSPADYAGMAVFLDKQKPAERDDVIHELIDIQYDRNDYELSRGTFRVRGDALDVFPPYADNPIRIDFWGDEIEEISRDR